jgi:hypothetical protein
MSATNTWLQPSVRGAVPAPRESHTAIGLGSRILLFGGYDGQTRFNDTWVLNTLAVAPLPSEPVPLPSLPASPMPARPASAGPASPAMLALQAVAAQDAAQARSLFRAERTARLDAEAMRAQALRDAQAVQDQLLAERAAHDAARVQLAARDRTLRLAETDSELAKLRQAMYGAACACWRRRLTLACDTGPGLKRSTKHVSRPEQSWRNASKPRQCGWPSPILS